MVYFRGEKIGEGHGSSIQQGEKYAARKELGSLILFYIAFRKVTAKVFSKIS